MPEEVSHVDIIAEIRAHRAEYREGQRRQDDVAIRQAEALAKITHAVSELERDMAGLKERLRNYDSVAERLRRVENRQSWWAGAAALAGAALSAAIRKLGIY